MAADLVANVPDLTGKLAVVTIEPLTSRPWPASPPSVSNSTARAGRSIL
jgi:hypothetical protein